MTLAIATRRLLLTPAKDVGVPAGSLLLRGYSNAGPSLVLYGRDNASNPTRLLGKAS